jgi:hypothetical protein
MVDIYKIKFEGDLVGRGKRIEPFDVACANQNQLRAAILKQVCPKLATSQVDLAMKYIPNEGLSGLVVVGGWRPVGQFTVTPTEGPME